MNPDLAELVKTSPMPSTEEGTNNIEVFIAGYLMSPRYRFFFLLFLSMSRTEEGNNNIGGSIHSRLPHGSAIQVSFFLFLFLIVTLNTERPQTKQSPSTMTQRAKSPSISTCATVIRACSRSLLSYPILSFAFSRSFLVSIGLFCHINWSLLPHQGLIW